MKERNRQQSALEGETRSWVFLKMLVACSKVKKESWMRGGDSSVLIHKAQP
jgi:hypothetical protein